MALVSLGLLLLTQPGSAEFVVSSVALGIALLFALTIVILVRRSVRRTDGLWEACRNQSQRGWVEWKGGGWRHERV